MPGLQEELERLIDERHRRRSEIADAREVGESFTAVTSYIAELRKVEDRIREICALTGVDPEIALS